MWECAKKWKNWRDQYVCPWNKKKHTTNSISEHNHMVINTYYTNKDK